MRLRGSNEVGSQAEFVWVLGIGMAGGRSGGDGKRWGTAECGQSRRIEVVFLRRMCRESLACIWFLCFFLSVRAPKKNMSEKTNELWSGMSKYDCPGGIAGS